MYGERLNMSIFFTSLSFSIYLCTLNVDFCVICYTYFTVNVHTIIHLFIKKAEYIPYDLQINVLQLSKTAFADNGETSSFAKYAAVSLTKKVAKYTLILIIITIHFVPLLL